MFRAVFVALFFASGFTALIYQVVWQRLLTLVTGTDANSVAIIVASFMVGLGLGSLAGGYLADRLAVAGRLWLFAGCEAAIALFALVSVTLYYEVLYVSFGARDLPMLAAGALSAAATLVPTFFMGMSLPLAVRVVTDDPRHPARWVPILYGWNTLGAAAGALVTVTVLLPSLAFDQIVRLAALVNAACAVAACGLVLAPTHGGPAHASVADGTTNWPEPRTPGVLPMWLALAALSSFVALALELVWFRLLGVILKANAATFGVLLASYLAGFGAGSLAARTPAALRWPAARSFFALQAAVPISTALMLALFVGLVGVSPQTGRVWGFLNGFEGRSQEEWSLGAAMVLGGILIAGLMAAPTFLMGLSVGSLQRAVQSDVAGLGRRVGALQAAGIAGAASGALITGFFLLDWFGTSGTLRVLVAIAGVFTWLALRDLGSFGGRKAALAAATMVAGTIAVVPGPAVLWPRLHGVSGEVVLAEDRAGVALFKVTDSTVVVYVNGQGQSELPYGDIHTILGALPLMLHRHPARIAVIGLGSGDTAFSLGGRSETTLIDSIEIVTPVLTALRELAGTKSYPGLSQLLVDPRVRHHMTDGRAFLLKTSQRYDLIEADALRPFAAHAGHLYSVEYFALLRERLNPGGFAVTWLPTRRVLESVRAAFPYVLAWDDIAIGSDRPIGFDPAELRTRINNPFTEAHYRAAGIDLAVLLDEFLQATPRAYTPRDARPLPADLNEDRRPRDEFGAR